MITCRDPLPGKKTHPTLILTFRVLTIGGPASTVPVGKILTLVVGRPEAFSMDIVLVVRILLISRKVTTIRNTLPMQRLLTHRVPVKLYKYHSL